jgi:hypothetical protein
MFLATATVENKTEECLVKLVYGRYGTEVHTILAENILAPHLVGTLTIPGAPIAMAMEHLQPPSPGKEGWVTLFSLGKNIESDAQRGLALTVHEIVQKLEQANLVHRDLRLNNLMVHVTVDGKILLVDGKARIKVIDFDWSGKSCQVAYPRWRNANIAWPAQIGEAIFPHHDRTLVERWWKETFPNQGYPPHPTQAQT